MASPCRRQIAPATLSDYRSRMLPRATQAELEAHIPTCAACQAVLASFERVADDLRAQRVPAMEDALWRDVQDQMRRERTPVNRKPLLLTALGASAALVTLFVVVFVVLIDRKTPSLSISATATVGATATIAATQTPLPKVWQAVKSINYGKNIAFSQSDPQTGYVCGNTAQNGNQTSIQLGVSHDGGATWSSLPSTPVTGNNCFLFVNPYNAQDVMLYAASCWTGCGDGNFNAIRSLDGGQTWQPVTLPSGNEASGLTGLGFPTWTTSAMFVSPFYTFAGPTNPPPHHYVAVSVNDGPLAWTAANPPVQSVGGSDFAVGDTFGFAFEDSQTCYETADNGATWQTFTATAKPQDVENTYQGQNLLGSTGLQSLAISHDGGHTWSPVALPGGNATMLGSAPFLLEPDGSMIVTLAPFTNGAGGIKRGIYERNTAGTWTLIVPVSTEGTTYRTLTAVSTDSNGHAVFIWSATVVFSNQKESPVLEFFPL